LSHLSHDNNSPGLVQHLFDSHANGAKIIVASRFEETPVFFISNETKTDNFRPGAQLQLCFG